MENDNLNEVLYVWHCMYRYCEIQIVCTGTVRFSRTTQRPLAFLKVNVIVISMILVSIRKQRCEVFPPLPRHDSYLFVLYWTVFG